MTRYLLRSIRLLVLLALMLPLGLASWFPTMVEFALGAPAHVCQCALRGSGIHGGHDSCACPICHPDRPDFKRHELSVRGPCGDDEPMPPSELPQMGILPSSFVRAPAQVSFVLPLEYDHPPAMPDLAPPIPPPKLATT